ncbi:hypothetical protein [Aliiroseovarius sp. YM-037]|uniref:hypothetical protein n=1 Tax=Aliiroseovarius sp. YM-037 TaxID=3341728 RepID=UPI003A7F7448
MNRIILSALPVAILAACQPTPTEEGLPLLAGYRDPADQCRIVGENDFTNQFLDDSADLVGCPENYEGIGVFMREVDETEVARTQGYVLFSVSRG